MLIILQELVSKIVLVEILILMQNKQPDFVFVSVQVTHIWKIVPELVNQSAKLDLRIRNLNFVLEFVLHLHMDMLVLVEIKLVSLNVQFKRQLFMLRMVTISV